MAEVAAVIEWSEASVRRHLIEIDDWRARGGHGCGLVPFIWRGAQKRIPAWWVRDELARLERNEPHE